MRASRIVQREPSKPVDIRCGFGSDAYLIEWTLFLIAAYVVAYVVDIDKAWFEGVMNGVTHLAALPALWSGSSIAPQVGISVLVSVAYHIVAAVDDQSDLYPAFEQLDVGMSVALIANVLLVYMDHISHAPITFISVGAASFPQYNVYIAGFVILVGYPITTIISYNGYSAFNMDKWILLALQVVSILAYLLADTYTEYSLHPIWHTASLLSIYYMIRIQKKVESEPAQKTTQREQIMYRF